MDPSSALNTFKLAKNVYALGIMERGVTIYNQQLRAHNLVWAISATSKKRKKLPEKFAVIGGGISGLTAAACIADKFPRAKIVVFEKRADLCPLQQGADHRHVQPRIYNWPDAECLLGESDLPWLGWKQARASEVSLQVLEGFSDICRTRTTEATGNPFEIWLGVEHIQLDLSETSIEWVGRCSEFDKGFLRNSDGVGDRRKFDKIVVATGFGLEKSPVGYDSVSYWRNEHRSQPVLDGVRQTILISGFGDGALTDLCRLTLERFQQSKIIEEMFPAGNFPDWLVRIKRRAITGEELFAKFLENESNNSDALAAVKRRLRKDTKVFLHLGGAEGKNTNLAIAFGGSSSFFNRYMLFLLYRCGAFTPIFSSMADAVRESQVSLEGVVCRHGADTLSGLKSLLKSKSWLAVEARLAEMKEKQSQRPEPWYELGFFKKEAL